MLPSSQSHFRICRNNPFFTDWCVLLSRRGARWRKKRAKGDLLFFSSLLSYHFSSFSHILIALSRLWLIWAIPILCYSILTRLKCLSISGKFSHTHYTLFTVSTDIPMIFNLLLFLVLTQNSLEKNVLPITPFILAISYSFNSIAVSFNQFGLNTGVPRLSTHS